MRTTQTRQLPCGFSEDLLIAEALRENSYNLSQQVTAHFGTCHACRQLLDRYQRLHAHLSAMSSPQAEAQGLLVARQRLDARLTHKNRPRLQLKVWHSPVGDIRLGKTEKGVALVEFVRQDEATASSARWRTDFTIENDGEEVAALIRKLEDYFSGKTHTLEWIVDDVLMRSDFQREVLRATAEVPYGTVVTYQSIADTISQPKAVRAVAQALRYNPVPIHIPCHRIIGSDGALTGYAGNLVEIKQKILAVEGIPVVATSKGLAIPRTRMYVGWRHGRQFCRPDCSCLKEQTAGDRAFIPSQVRAEEMGYAPCDVCRPDIHPLV
ncbi:MAG: methylated-DNA--[protein]-cysteine S-methyltransferase [Candidatus Binatia bacterium]